MENNHEHWLKQELSEKLGSGLGIFQFVLDGSLDGIWYLDCSNPELLAKGEADEYYSDDFWHTLGYDPATKTHKAHEWQSLIHPDDLIMAVENYDKHLQDPSFPYDMIVRYKRPDDSWTWVRCRGLVIKDDNGKPIRMLGAHTDVTNVTKLKKEVLGLNKDIESLKSEIAAAKEKIKLRQAKLD